MTEFAVTIHDLEKSLDAKLIREGLIRYNQNFVDETAREITVIAKDTSGEISGGLTGHTAKSWLYVNLFWIADAARGKGLGSKLLASAEEEAVQRGCRNVWLDTFSFQALGFYEKRGYAVFGKLENYPPGHERFFLQKALIST